MWQGRPYIRYGPGLTERWDRVLLHPLWGRLAAFLVIPAGCVLGAALGMMTGGLVLFAVLAWAPDLKAAYPGPLGSLAADALLPAFGWVVALLSMISALYAIFLFWRTPATSRGWRTSWIPSSAVWALTGNPPSL